MSQTYRLRPRRAFVSALFRSSPACDLRGARGAVLAPGRASQVGERGRKKRGTFGVYGPGCVKIEQRLRLHAPFYLWLHLWVGASLAWREGPDVIIAKF